MRSYSISEMGSNRRINIRCADFQKKHADCLLSQLYGVTTQAARYPGKWYGERKKKWRSFHSRQSRTVEQATEASAL